MFVHGNLNVLVDVNKIQSEILGLDTSWLPHFNTRNYEGKWDVLALRSPGGSLNEIIPDAINYEDYINTELMDSCPAINFLLDSFKCRKMSVRLLNLKSGSVIKEHRDFDLCFEQGEARIHIPIFTNHRVEFYLDNQLLEMREGECWYINANLKHRVVNKGNADRIHLVVDLQVNDWLYKLFVESKVLQVEVQKSYYNQLKIIKELRLQKTATANKLADELEKELQCF